MAITPSEIKRIRHQVSRETNPDWTRTFKLGYSGNMPNTPNAYEINEKSYATPIVFFDGVCGLCNQFVDWIIALGNSTQHILFSPLQGQTAKHMLDGDTIRNLSSVVLSLNGKLYRKSAAVLMVMKQAKGFQLFPIRLISTLLLVIPSSLSDRIYDAIANRRYEFFGKMSTCRIPTATERTRFLP